MVAERESTGADIAQTGRHTEKDERFFRMLRRFSPEAQEFVTSLSSMFMEPDVRKDFGSNPDRVTGLRTELQSMGLNHGQVRQVMRFFNFASPPPSGTEGTR